jgi:LDH2 family malate/lactate/ureidoglycolate dehydrogenase
MKRAKQLVDSIHAAKPIPGEEVTLPGERGDARVKQVEDAGEIDIADAIWNELTSFVAN